MKGPARAAYTGQEQAELRKRFMEAQIGKLNELEHREAKIIAGPDGKPIYSTDYDGKSTVN